MSVWTSVSDSAESYVYIETIWDAGASLWDDDTSHWDGAYVNDWTAVPDVTAEVWA